MTRAISDLSRVSHRVGTTCVQLSDLSALIWAVLSHCLKQLGWKFFRLFFLYSLIWIYMTHDHIECDQSQIGLSSVLICSLRMSWEIPQDLLALWAARASIIVFDINAFHTRGHFRILILLIGPDHLCQPLWKIAACFFFLTSRAKAKNVNYFPK